MRMSGYPETVVVSSQGPAAEMFPLAMGVYTMTDVTHSDRPVWRGRDWSIVFNGNKYHLMCIIINLFNLQISFKSGEYSRKIIMENISSTLSNNLTLVFL